MNTNNNKYNLDPKLKCVKCQKNLPQLDCNPDFFRYFVNGKDNNYCDVCLPQDLLEQRIEREHFVCLCKGGKLFNKCHDLRRNISNNPLYWDNGTFKFECYYCGGKLGKNGEKIYECEEPHCERKFCSCSCRSRNLNCQKPNHHQTQNQNSPNENFEQRQKDHQQAHEKAQSYWDALSSSEREKELVRVVENMKLGKYWANNVKEGEASGSARDGFYMWTIKNGKFVSDTPHKVPVQISEEFMKNELGFGDNLAIEWIETQMIVVNNNDKVSPLTSTNPSLSPNNSQPQLPPSEIDTKTGNDQKTLTNNGKNGAKEVEIINNGGKDNNKQKQPTKNDNETLIINLKTIKKITLTADGNLVIEFNKSENNDNSQTQIITEGQINNNQELQKIKDYLEKSQQKSASQQDLANILNTNSNVSEKPKDNNNVLLIIGISGALIIGVVIGLVLTRKRNIKKS